MTALRIVIADDERPARSYLRAVLDTYDDVTVVGEAANGADAVSLIERTRPDLALLDLQMPELDGLDVVRMVHKSKMPLIAFVTAYDAYAVRAFELHAVDYLLKPVDPVRLRETLNRAHERLEQSEARDFVVSAARHELEEAMHTIGSAPDAPLSAPLTRIPVRRRDDIIFVAVSDLASIGADGEILILTTKSGERHRITYRLKDLEQRLDSNHFVRVSRSALVRIDAIAKINPMPGGTYVLTLINRQSVPVSRLRARVLRESLFKL